MTDAEDQPPSADPTLPSTPPAPPGAPTPPVARPLAPPSGPPVAYAPPEAVAGGPAGRGGTRVAIAIAAVIAVVAVVFATLSYTRGNSWKHRAQTAERYQAQLTKQLNDSEADAKDLEGRLSTEANLSAKNTDERAFAESVINGVSHLAEAADSLANNTAACANAVQHLQSVVGTDASANLNAGDVRSATDAVGKSCSGLEQQVSDIQSAISGIGQ